MTVSREENGYVFIECDKCGYLEEEGFESFEDALHWLKKSDWGSVSNKSITRYLSWENYCPDCRNRQAASDFK